MWVLSYCDLLCQLICFFLLLFAMSTVQNKQWQHVKSSLSQRLNPDKTVLDTPPAAEISIERMEVTMAQDIGYLNRIIGEKIENSDLAKRVAVQQQEDRLVIRIAGDESFLRGSTQMTGHLQEILTMLSDIMRTIPNRVEINGNADPTPVSGKLYASNWELSLARALAAADFLKERGYPYALSIFGRGDSTYRDIPQEFSAKERERLSRHIDIIIRNDRAELSAKPL